MLVQDRPIDVLGQNIRRVGYSWYSDKLKVAFLDAILHPKIGSGKMANFTKAFAPAAANRSGSVGGDSDLPGKTEIAR